VSFNRAITIYLPKTDDEGYTMKKTNMLATAIVTASVAFSSVAHAKQTLCVFDLLGTGGDVYAMMKDYSLAAAKWGADVDLKPYTDERIVLKTLKQVNVMQ
jgi:hypothetical protein